VPLRWYNISRTVRVYINDLDLQLINKYRRSKKISRSSLNIEEQYSMDTLVKKSVFGRYKQGEETFYLFNK
tara:strand:+ start:614 stop:826 length:213 start_codon:yes stop_codon:yes gene_type:complete